MSTHESILTASQVQALRFWASDFDTSDDNGLAVLTEEAIPDAQSILFSEEFKSGEDLTEAQLGQLFTAMRTAVWNLALGSLMQTPQDRHQISIALRDLCFGTSPITERIDRFVQLPKVGPMTLSQFLNVIDPSRFPFISDLTLQVLVITSDQRNRAQTRAIEKHNIISPDSLDRRTLTFLGDAEIFAEAKNASGLEDYMTLNRMLWSQRNQEAPNVLFVNIGWSDFYDGSELIKGAHNWITTHNQDPMQISEGSAFEPDDNGEVTCGVGNGTIRKEGYTDVVFVARDPETYQYKAVGIYYNPTFSYQYVGKAQRKFGIASTDTYFLLPAVQRHVVEWPLGQSMRRWAKDKGKDGRWPELLPSYRLLRILSIQDEQNDIELLNRHGRAGDPDNRRAVEDRAIAVTKEYFNSHGKSVKEMPRNHPGFDLTVTGRASGDEQQVEVKGTTRNGHTIDISSTELDLLKSGESVLAVVRNIQLLNDETAIGGELVIHERIGRNLDSGAVQAKPLQYQLVFPSPEVSV